jgi:PAS domain S-box-containing protein
MVNRARGARRRYFLVAFGQSRTYPRQIISALSVLKLRSHLLALTLGAVLPLVVFVVLVTAVLHRQEREGMERGLRDTARALSLAVDRELQSTLATLAALATSSDLDGAADLHAFAHDAGRVLPSQAGWTNVLVFDRSGREIYALRPSRGMVDENRVLVGTVTANARPEISGLRAQPDGAGHVITVTVPVVRDGRVRYVLAADISPDAIGSLLIQQQLPQDWQASIIDQDHIVLARAQAPERHVGRMASVHLRQALATGPEGSLRGRTPDGVDAITSYSRSPLTGWTVALAMPVSAVAPALRRSIVGVVLVGLALCGVATVLALLLGRRIAGSMGELSATARALGRGQVPPEVSSGVAEINAVGGAIHEAGALLRQRAEEGAAVQAALAEREERLRLALSAGQMVTWDWDLRTGTVTWSEDLPFFRREGCNFDGTAEDVLRFVHPGDRAELRDRISRALKGAEGCEVEFRVAGPDGERGWVALRGRAFHDNAGRPIRMLGVATDVTARKRAEADSETLAALVKSSDDAIIGKTLDGRILTWNAGAERVYGYTADEAKGRSVAMLFPPDQRHELTAILRRVRVGEAVEWSGVQVRHDGRRIEVAKTVSPIRDGGGRLVGVSTIARDVTAWRRHERQVLNLQALTDAALAHHSLDELLADLLGRLCAALDCDAATVLLLSEDGRDLVVRAAHGLQGDVGARVPVDRGVVGRIVQSRQPVVADDLSEVETVGSSLAMRGLVSLLGMRLVVDRRVIGAVHVATAVPRRFTEDEIRLLRLAADRIALAVDHGRLFDAERVARADAEAANRTKDQFLATLSHELRTPLTAMLGWVRMLRAGRLDAAASARALETIERSTRAQAQLINDLLDISRIVSGKLTMELVPVDAGDVVQAAVDAVRPMADAKSIAVEYQAPLEPATASADPGRLQQIVSNLLTNAIKFTPDAGRVSVAVERDERGLTIRVADTGKGIAPGLLP